MSSRAKKILSLAKSKRNMKNDPSIPSHESNKVAASREPSTLKKTDQERIESLSIPYHESTKGTSSSEQNTLLENRRTLEKIKIISDLQIKKIEFAVHSTPKWENDIESYDEMGTDGYSSPINLEKSTEVNDSSATSMEFSNSRDESLNQASSGNEYIPSPTGSYSTECDSSKNDIESIQEDELTTPPKISNVDEFAELIPLTTLRKSCIENPSSPSTSVNSNFGELKTNGEKRKGNKKMDFCLFCESLVLNFARHIRRNHAYEIEVQRIVSLDPKSTERINLLSKLRKRGNYLNSNTICKPMQKQRSGSELLPCSNCLGFYSSKLLWKHRNKCTGIKDRSHMSNAQNLLTVGLQIDPHLKRTVFPRMRPDEISLWAKKDTLICAYGSRYIKIHRDKHFINVASRKMRELARLLIELNKMDSSIKSLLDALKPQNFDLIVAATRTVAKFDNAKEMFESPTYALNMGTTLKQCAELAILFVLKRKHVAESNDSIVVEADLKTLIQVIESQWKYEISSQAANDLNVSKWNKVSIVPLASDLRLLKEHLVVLARKAIDAFHKKKNVRENYKILMETVFCRVMLLNRRRPGELQRLPLHIYEDCERKQTSYEEFSEMVSASEKILLKKFKRVVVKGKRGRGVPILFSDDIQEHIKILMDHRKDVVNKYNQYLFANPNSTQPLCGYKVLNKYAHSCGASNPKSITSTRLRKHLATLTQVFSMSENDMEQLANFMGHTLGVHKGSYRLPDDVYQTAKISKLLLLMEKGRAAEFKGKPLNEIELDLEEDLLMENGNDPNVESLEVYPDPLNPEVEIVEESPSLSLVNTKKKRVLESWTNEQKKIVSEYFAGHIRNKRPPKKYECMALKENNAVLLQNKNWLKIKVYIQNLYTKKVKQYRET